MLNPNLQNNTGNTPLHYGVIHGSIEALKILLAGIPDILLCGFSKLSVFPELLLLL